jgi:hypothetical protein
MNEAEKLSVGALLSAITLVIPGFLLHVAPRFPGSLAGSLFGIAGATLLLLVLVYSLVKRAPWVKARVTKYASSRAVLAFHIYVGVLGALLGIIHTGHKFYSPLGVGLVTTMLTVIFTGFIGRYYLADVTTDLREQQQMLAVLRTRYDGSAVALAGDATDPLHVSLAELVDGIAQLEYEIAGRETIKTVFSRWIVVHVASAILMYSFLALHIWNGLYYGLRWLG